MVIVFRDNKRSAAMPAVAGEQRSFAYAVTLSMAIGVAFWAGIAALLRL